MKAENTIPLDVDLMTGNKEAKDIIKESELCENCKGNFYDIEYNHTSYGCTFSCGSENICKNVIACKNFYKEKEHIPSYYTNIRGSYNGKDKDKLWENVNKKEIIAVKGDNKMEVTEKELCEYCGSKTKCISCKYSKNCDNFCEIIGVRPYYLLKEGKYIGKHPDKLWEEKEFKKEINKIEKREEKEKNSMLPKNVKITNKIEENTVYVNDCSKYPISKYPIKSDEEYVCVFNGNTFVSNSAVANIEITGNIINMSKDIIVIYNKEVKKVYIIEVGSIKCLVPKSLHEIITSLNDNK